MMDKAIDSNRAGMTACTSAELPRPEDQRTAQHYADVGDDVLDAAHGWAMDADPVSCAWLVSLRKSTSNEDPARGPKRISRTTHP